MRQRSASAGRSRARRAAMLALSLGLLAGTLLLGSGIAWARPAGAARVAVSGASHAATATGAAQTPTTAPTVVSAPAPAPTPVTLTSSGLVLFTTLGCILGVIGLLAFGIAWITLLSDGWGPMLKALILGNRKGTLRFARKERNTRGRMPTARDRRTPMPRDRAGWR